MSATQVRVQDLVTAGMVEDDIRIEGMKVSFSLIFDKPNSPFIKSVVKAAEKAILTYVSPEVQIEGNISVKVPEVVPQDSLPLLPKVKNTLAIFSGKGGVGKSTVSANLAVALAQAGYKVGLLDADIFGPSQPKMFGCEDERPVLEDVDGQELIAPVERFGVRMLSIGFFVNKESPVLWRGSMASNALKQLLTETNWGELDYLLIDLPPGTSDIHLTLVQTLGLTGALIVTTPQQVAWQMPSRAWGCSSTSTYRSPSLGWWRIWHGSLLPSSHRTNTISSGVMVVRSWLKSWTFLCSGRSPSSRVSANAVTAVSPSPRSAIA